MSKLYSVFNTKTDQTNSPHFKYSVKNELTDEWEKFELTELEGIFSGAWHSTDKFKDEEWPVFCIRIDISDKQHVIKIKHYKPGYDLINLLSQIPPYSNVAIKLEKRQDSKDKSKWWPVIKVGIVDGEMIRQVEPAVPYKDYPRAIPATNARGQIIKDKAGKDTYDFTDQTTFWNEFFDKICDKFKNTTTHDNTW